MRLLNKRWRFIGRLLLCTFTLVFTLSNNAMGYLPAGEHEQPVQPKPVETWKGVVKGNVTSKSTGNPIPETEVTLIPLETKQPPGKRAPIKTKATPEGNYEIPNVPDGTYTAIVKGTCHEKTYQTVVVQNGQTTVADFQPVKKPVKVVIETTLEEMMAYMGFLDFSGADAFMGAKVAAAGINPEDVENFGDMEYIEEPDKNLPPEQLKKAKIVIEVQVFLKDKKPGTGTPPICQADIPTKTSTTGKATIETNIPREGQADPKRVPDDPLYHTKGSWGQKYDDQWALKRIGFTPMNDVNSAWNPAGMAGAPVIVAVIDSGVDATHPELIGKLWKNEKEIAGNGKDDDRNGYIDDVNGWNFIDKNNNVADLNGHGTFNAGIIAATVHNGIGMAGINPNVRIMPLKAIDFDLKGGSIETARAIYYAADNGARVINISIGGKQRSWIEQKAIDYAHRKGVVVVVAAGNEGIDMNDYSPAGLNHVITVASTDDKDKRTAFSNWGQNVALAAPGVDILSLRAGNTDLLVLSGPKEYEAGRAVVGEDENYYRATGTSFSAPLVSGVASLILSNNPKLTGEQVERMILHSADDIDVPGWDQFTGYGLINAKKALNADPDYYTIAKISKIAPARKEGKLLIEVYGHAESSDFDSAWVELGLGEKPGEWKKAGKEIGKNVKEGLLAEITPDVFTKGGKWSLRLIVKTKNHGTREAWGSLNIK
jgi:subtilisin family serine protease